MAEAAAAGAREVEGAEVELYQIQETFTPEILEKMGATDAKSHLPIYLWQQLINSQKLMVSFLASLRVLE